MRAAGDIRVRRLVPDDVSELIPVLARAFEPQPFTRWLVGRERGRLSRGERLLALDFEQALPFRLSYTTDGLHGAALWLPPDREAEPWRTLMMAMRVGAVLGVNREAPARLRALYRAERAAPQAPNYYLAVLAVVPAMQRQGIGSALLRPVLARCDAEDMPAYLETDTPANVRFYRRHGFDVRDELVFAGGAVRLWTMWRPPGPVTG